METEKQETIQDFAARILNRKKITPLTQTAEQVLYNSRYWERVYTVPIARIITPDELSVHAQKRLLEIVENPIGEKFSQAFDFLTKYFVEKHTKGVMLIGGVGCGKTTLMRIFQPENIKNSENVPYYQLISCRSIARDFSENGASCFEKYTKGVICFDDLGTETAAKYYGTSSSVMEELIYERYEKRLITHFTTNLSLQEIGNMYGERIRSRLIEMCNILDFQNEEDKRK